MMIKQITDRIIEQNGVPTTITVIGDKGSFTKSIVSLTTDDYQVITKIMYVAGYDSGRLCNVGTVEEVYLVTKGHVSSTQIDNIHLDTVDEKEVVVVIYHSLADRYNDITILEIHYEEDFLSNLTYLIDYEIDSTHLMIESYLQGFLTARTQQLN